MRLTPVQDFTNEHMRHWASRHLTAGCHVVSDGTRAFAQVRQAQASASALRDGRWAQGAQTPGSDWVNTLLGNLKTSMAGTLFRFV